MNGHERETVENSEGQCALWVEQDLACLHPVISRVGSANSSVLTAQWQKRASSELSVSGLSTYLILFLK